MKLLLKKVSLFCFLLSTITYAQQDAQYTQYMYNTIAINPAYAGSRDVLSVFGMYRTQWVGLEGAPKTAILAGHSPISPRMGFGLSVLNDQIGPSDESTIGADVSYKIPLNNDFNLLFGVKVSANLLNIDYTKLDNYNPTDPSFQNNVENQLSPNFGSGVYLHSEKAYLGVSVPFILQTKHYSTASNSVAKDRMHYYFMGGYVFDVSKSVQFKPAVLSKFTTGAPIQLDMSANFLINEKFTLGAAYRWGSAFSGLAGFQISDKMFIGYAYDRDANRLGNYNSGSHEIFLRFEFLKSIERVKSPRFF